MPDKQALLEKRSTTIKEMRSLSDKAETENRDLSDKEQNDFKLLKQDLGKIDGQIERAEVLADAERSMESVTPRAGHDGSFEQQCRNYSITTAIAGHLEPGQVDDGRERETSNELSKRSGRNPSGIYVPHEVFQEQRALLTSNSSELIPDRHRSELMIDRLRENLVTQRLGATVLNGLTGNQTIPKLTGSATPYWVAEHGDITPSDQTFGSVTLAPKTAGAEVEYSRRMILNASPSIEQLIRNDLAFVIAQAIDTAALIGDGASNNPTGITNTAGIGSVIFSGAPTWAKILEFATTLSTDHALMGSLGWIAEPQAVKTLRSTEKVSGHPEYIMNGVGELGGYPLSQTTTLPNVADASTIVFGNWSDLLIGYWSAVDILVNPYHSDVYSKGGVKINALQDCDIAVRHPESFVVATDLSTA